MLRACVMMQRDGVVRASLHVSACVYVCKRDCVILHFKLAIFENICNNVAITAVEIEMEFECIGIWKMQG